MKTIELPKGVTVRMFTRPPADFDPLKADERSLLVHGVLGRIKHIFSAASPLGGWAGGEVPCPRRT